MKIFDDRKRELVMPVKVLAEKFAVDCAKLLKRKALQVISPEQEFTLIENGGFVLLDFGKQMHGQARLLFGESPNHQAAVRIRFGESASEACADLDEKNSGNNHSIRDYTVDIVSNMEFNTTHTGFRFLRIDVVGGAHIKLKSAIAVAIYQDLPYKGMLKTSDDLVNRIYDTAAYTAHLCIQNGVIWDGIKRDRMVWAGDLHPEMLTIFNVFGNGEYAKRSLDMILRHTDADSWVNLIPAYSMWWVICICDYCMYTGDLSYYKNNFPYIEKILNNFINCMDSSGNLILETSYLKMWEPYFLDWPTLSTPAAKAGVRYLLIWGAEKVLYFNTKLDIKSELASTLIRRLRRTTPPRYPQKQIAAFANLAGVYADSTSLLAGGAEGLSTFMSYYILTALSRTSSSAQAVAIMKQYFGGMLDRGATTFWEDFDIKWLENSTGIDSLPSNGKKDIHGDFGAHCYKGFRHSLCHGWASGALPFIVENVLGVRVLEPGYQSVSIKASSVGINSIYGKIPCPQGIIEVEHKLVNGKTKTEYSVPDGVKVIVD